MTQVVLPPEVLVRRRDGVASVGQAWRMFAAGAGARRVARQLGLPMETVRGWLRRLKQRARIMFGSTPGDGHDRLAWALALNETQANGAGWHEEHQIWRFVAYQSQGRLLTNTNSP